VFIAIEGYSQDEDFSQSQGQDWSQNSPWMTYSQLQFQHVFPQMHVSNSDPFGKLGRGRICSYKMARLWGQTVDSNSGSNGGRVFKMRQKIRYVVVVVVFFFFFLPKLVLCLLFIAHIIFFKKENEDFTKARSGSQVGANRGL
jgi:hypothetical protein